MNVGSADDTPLKEYCSEIHCTIFAALKKVFQKMQFDNIEVEPAFLCPCDLTPAHAATMFPQSAVTTKSQLVCSETELSVGKLQWSQGVWFQDWHGEKQPPNLLPTTITPSHEHTQHTLMPALSVRAQAQLKPETEASSSTGTSPDVKPLPQSMSVQPAQPQGVLSQATAIMPTKQQPMQSHPMSSSQEMQQQSVKPKERLPSTEDRPTLPKLLNFKTSSGTVNIAKRIGADYNLLGAFLLQDDDGTVTDAIANEYHHNAFKVNYEILKQWIQGKGRQPVQWSTLIDVLKEIELSELAKKIEESLQ